MYAFIFFLNNNPKIWNLIPSKFHDILSAAHQNFFESGDILETPNIGGTKESIVAFKAKFISRSPYIFENKSDAYEEYFEALYKIRSNFHSQNQYGYSNLEIYEYLTKDDFEILWRQAQILEYSDKMAEFFIEYFTKSQQYYQARSIFQDIKIYMRDFTQEALEDLVKKMNNNSQIYDNTSIEDMLETISNLMIINEKDMNTFIRSEKLEKLEKIIQ